MSMRRASRIEFVAAAWAVIHRLVLPIGHRRAARPTQRRRFGQRHAPEWVVGKCVMALVTGPIAATGRTFVRNNVAVAVVVRAATARIDGNADNIGHGSSTRTLLLSTLG